MNDKLDEKALADVISAELDTVEMVLSDPLTLRRLKAERIARAVLQALRPGSTGEAEGWREIASAPENDWVLAWSGEHVEMACRRDGRWLVANSYGVTINPTAWRPLPSPPSAMLAAAGGEG